MNAISASFGQRSSSEPTKSAFLAWQCRARQIVMRENGGRPDAAVTPELTLYGESVPFRRIVTVLPRRQEFSKTPEIRHLVQQTPDPRQRHDKAIEFFSEAYYQNSREFSGLLTATFSPISSSAKTIESAARCVLMFDAYGHRFDLDCAVRRLGHSDHAYDATRWHNLLFNPNLDPQIIVLGFEFDRQVNTAEPDIARKQKPRSGQVADGYGAEGRRVDSVTGQ